MNPPFPACEVYDGPLLCVDPINLPAPSRPSPDDLHRKLPAGSWYALKPVCSYSQAVSSFDCLDLRVVTKQAVFASYYHRWYFGKKANSCSSRYSFLEDLLITIGEGLRIPPEDTPCRTDRGTRGCLPFCSFFNAEVALHRLIDFMVELHDIIRTGLDTTCPTHDAPVAFLYSHVFCKSSLNLIKGYEATGTFEKGDLKQLVDRLHRIGLKIERVTARGRAVLGDTETQVHVDEEIDKLCRVTEMVGEAGIPVMLPYSPTLERTHRQGTVLGTGYFQGQYAGQLIDPAMSGTAYLQFYRYGSWRTSSVTIPVTDGTGHLAWTSGATQTYRVKFGGALSEEFTVTVVP